MATLAVCSLALAITIRYIVRGGDGNYFLFGLIPMIILAAGVASKHLSSSRFLMQLVLASIPAFVLFQASYSFLSGSWTPGTRQFDTQLDTSWKAMKKTNKRILDYYGLSKIAAHLRELPGHPRAAGFVEEPLLFRLPARYEDLALVRYSRPEYLTTRRPCYPSCATSRSLPHSAATEFHSPFRALRRVCRKGRSAHARHAGHFNSCR